MTSQQQCFLYGLLGGFTAVSFVVLLIKILMTIDEISTSDYTKELRRKH